jgi:hypothetical protein
LRSLQLCHCLRYILFLFQVCSRYFVAGLHRLDTEEQERLVPSSPAADQEASCSSNSQPLRRVNDLLSIARSRSAPVPHTPVQTQPDYIELAADSTLFTIDRNPQADGEEQDHITFELICPETLDEMLAIVRTLRQQRIARLQSMQTPSLMIVTPATSERRVDKSANTNNTEIVNISDIMNAR